MRSRRVETPPRNQRPRFYLGRSPHANRPTNAAASPAFQEAPTPRRQGQVWFLNFHCFTKYVKLPFFRGTSLRPVPPGESMHKEVRYLDIHEDDPLDEAQFTASMQ